MERKIFLWLTQFCGAEAAETWSVWVTVLAIALIAWLSYVICIRILNPIVTLLTLKTETTWDDDLLNENVLRATSQLAPAILVGVLLPDNLNAGEDVYKWTVKLTEIYILWAAIHLIVVFLRSLQNALDERHMLRQHNLEIVRQTVVLFVILIGVVFGVAILFNRDPLGLLTGLGASAAILMLVFRDTILNFVAGIQLTVNRMLGRGDWIVAPKAGVNGEVVEVKLTTIKVRNWDNSIVTIPPYTLVSDSFQNFNAMRQSGARRVSRSVLIDQTTIRFLTPEEMATLYEEGLIPPSVTSSDLTNPIVTDNPTSKESAQTDSNGAGPNPETSISANEIRSASEDSNPTATELTDPKKGQAQSSRNDRTAPTKNYQTEFSEKDGVATSEKEQTKSSEKEQPEEQEKPKYEIQEKVVNLTLLRKYMEWYLSKYPEIIHAGTGRPELTLMARQLQPTPQGIPFELYFFTSRTQWKPFEHLQADIFDHLYA
ncbi:MAG: mechanosensitive ion channel, partial [Muribaculaceae bacterium]|nr:mechanosensitive ion channel [Muribaculaceae bacterium]